MKNKKFFRLGFRLIGIIVFIFILIKIDITTSIDVVKNADHFLLFAACCVTLIHLSFQALCWQSLLKIQNIKPWSFKKIFQLFLIGQFYGIITPGKLGDVIRIFYMKRDLKTKYGEGIANILIHRLINVGTLLIIAVFTSFVYLKTSRLYLILVGFFFLSVSLLIIFLKNTKIQKWIKKQIEKTISKRLPESIKEQSSILWNSIRQYKTYNILIPVLYSLAVYIIMVLQGYYVVISLNNHISYFSMLFYVSIISLAIIVPITISGLGIREALFIYFFTKEGLTSEFALSFSLIFVVINYIIIATLGLWFQNLDPVPITKTEDFDKKDL
ncbi:lysylphosphatidylglycerol synthase transmembrane domain-containing protein [candidate division KSB1 bacterium]